MLTSLVLKFFIIKEIYLCCMQTELFSSTALHVMLFVHDLVDSA